MKCPICGESFNTGAERCVFCKTELNSKYPTVSGSNDNLENDWNQEQKNKKDEFFKNTMIASCINGIFNKDQFSTNSKGLYSDELEKLEKNGNIDSYKVSNSLQSLLTLISDLAIGDSKKACILNCDLDRITIVHLSAEDDSKISCERSQTVEWDELIKETYPQSRRDLALIGGYCKIDNGRLKEEIIKALPQENKPSFIVVTHNCQSGKHLDVVENVISDLGINVNRVPYTLASKENFDDFLRDLLHKAPLKEEIYLLIAQVDNNGNVKKSYYKLFPSNKQLESTKTTVKLKSLNENGQDIILAIFKKRNGQIENSPFKTKKINLPNSTSRDIIFSLDVQREITIQGINPEPFQIPWENFANNIPLKISIEPVDVDIVLMIETTTNENDFAIRKSTAKSILNRMREKYKHRLHTSVFSYICVVPNNRYESKINSCIWNSNNDIDIFIEEMKCSEINPACFHSEIDQCLSYVINTDFEWQANDHRIVVIIGSSPPNYRYKFQYLDNNMANFRKDKISVFSIVWPINWPIIKPNLEPLTPPTPKQMQFRTDFWKTVSYSGKFDQENLNLDKVIHEIDQVCSANKNNLKIPIINNEIT